jgi:hypothetical protein
MFHTHIELIYIRQKNKTLSFINAGHGARCRLSGSRNMLRTAVLGPVHIILHRSKRFLNICAIFAYHQTSDHSSSYLLVNTLHLSAEEVCVTSVLLGKKENIQNSEGTASVVWWSHFLATVAEVPGSITGATKFCEYQWI